MNWEATFAYLHYAAIFALTGALMAEYTLLRQPDVRPFVPMLARMDLILGLCALTVLLTGLSRLFWFGKGVDFYVATWLFHLKLTLFVMAVLVSIVPSVKLAKWRRAERAGTLEITPAEQKSVRLLVLLEMHFIFVIPLVAVFMARGYGQP